jgi:hypothetical protein
MKYNRELLEIKSSFCILSQTGRACLDAPMQSFIPKNWRELQKVAPIFFFCGVVIKIEYPAITLMHLWNGLIKSFYASC